MFAIVGRRSNPKMSKSELGTMRGREAEWIPMYENLIKFMKLIDLFCTNVYV